MRRCLPIALLTTLGGCAAIVDVDEYRLAENLQVQLDNYQSLAESWFEVQLIDQDSGKAEARAVLVGTNPDSGDAVAIPIQGAVDPEADYQVQVLVDGNRDQVYEEAFVSRKKPGHDFFVVNLNGAPSESIETPGGRGGDFAMYLRNMDTHVDRHLELMLIDETAGRGVGYAYVARIESQMVVRIPGVIAPEHEYRLEFYADDNGDHWYTPPGAGGDHAWMHRQESTQTGLSVDFQHNDNIRALTVF